MMSSILSVMDRPHQYRFVIRPFPIAIREFGGWGVSMGKGGEDLVFAALHWNIAFLRTLQLQYR
jgi:hypothetical protein